MTKPKDAPDVPEQETGEPYPLPELAPEELAELEEATAQRVATVRDEQSLRIANLGNDRLPHFPVVTEGAEEHGVCGTCGSPWPCTAWTRDIEPVQVAESEGIPQQGDVYTPGEVAAAQALGITAAEVRRKFRAT